MVPMRRSSRPRNVEKVASPYASEWALLLLRLTRGLAVQFNLAFAISFVMQPIAEGHKCRIFPTNRPVF